MTLPEGAVFAPGELGRVNHALEALKSDPHAAREVTVTVKLHVHHEYPKHVVVGKDEKTGEPIVKIVHNAKEEAALRPEIPEEV